jgi:hypothetical protein
LIEEADRRQERLMNIGKDVQKEIRKKGEQAR